MNVGQKWFFLFPYCVGRITPSESINVTRKAMRCVNRGAPIFDEAKVGGRTTWERRMPGSPPTIPTAVWDKTYEH